MSANGGHRCAERELHGIDDEGARERIVIWIERRHDARWAVGRAVNPELRESPEPRESDYVFTGYELDDALEAANGTLDDDVRVSEELGVEERVRPFRRDELTEVLERSFFGRA